MITFGGNYNCNVLVNCKFSINAGVSSGMSSVCVSVSCLCVSVVTVCQCCDCVSVL